MTANRLLSSRMLLNQFIARRKRILLAILLSLGLLAAFSYLPFPHSMWPVTLLAAVAAWEWGRLAGLQARGRLVFAGLQSCACLAGIWGAMMMPAFGVAVLFWHLVAPFWVWRRWRMKQTRARRIFLLCLGFCLILAVWIALYFIGGMVVLLFEDWMLPTALGIVWVSYLFAWIARRLFGGEPAPDYPGKMLAGVVYMLIGILWIMDPREPVFHSLWSALPFALLLATMGILGELFVALLGRQAGVAAHDLLPGYGGALAVLPCFMFGIFLGIQA